MGLRQGEWRSTGSDAYAVHLQIPLGEC
jgi:hypothetical protein